MGTTVTIDAEELAALRVLARKALASSESDDVAGLGVQATDGTEGDSDEEGDTERPSIEDLPLTWQETNVVETLVLAGGAVVPPDRLVRHIHNTSRNAEADRWVRCPYSQVARAKAKMRARFGTECIEPVWHTRVNRAGRVVRDWQAGLRGYRWVGPDVEDMIELRGEGL